MDLPIIYHKYSPRLQDDGEQASTGVSEHASRAGLSETKTVLMDRGRHKLLLAEQKMARTKAADDAVRFQAKRDQLQTVYGL